ncbi:hypothetical protein CcrColossus_gp246 [Caulobacter phage CcrColossus]|uniref:Uncharacterized protein n=1 Tax=Caulobacter phage CcrColossus TaxID=1211640 RepID=K4JSM2_9CAUD|nr:hypothetical protein CcrColossus_gp246 [Caulobacter phage CcrColossus]AFU88116.1 hypothetical protein CcrColossus_gp246 [Caulobacter phage CcrColossus]
MTNDRLKRSIEFDLTDAPMLMHAMSIAACTAMMCGQPGADKKLRAYKAVFQAFVPPEAAGFVEERWAEMGMALMTAKTFHVTVLPRSWESSKTWWSEGYLTVILDGKPYHADRGVSPYVKRGDDAAPQALHRYLQDIAPMDCIGTWDNGRVQE